MDTSWSQVSATSRDRPSPSEPTTTTSGTFSLSLNANGLNALYLSKLFGVPYFSIGMGLISAPDHTWLFGFSGGDPITLTATYPKLCKVS